MGRKSSATFQALPISAMGFKMTLTLRGIEFLREMNLSPCKNINPCGSLGSAVIKILWAPRKRIEANGGLQGLSRIFPHESGTFASSARTITANPRRYKYILRVMDKYEDYNPRNRKTRPYGPYRTSRFNPPVNPRATVYEPRLCFLA